MLWKLNKEIKTSQLFFMALCAERSDGMEVKMKFMKGVMIGGLITTGLIMMYTENDMMSKKKIIKKGKQIAKKMGM